MNTEKLRRFVSLAAAVAVAVSGISMYFPSCAEEGKETENKNVSELIEVETEESGPRVCEVTLPFYDGCGYICSAEQLKETEENGDLLLHCEAGRELEIVLDLSDSLQVTDIHVTDKEGLEIDHVWDEASLTVSFTMPEKNVRISAEFSQKEEEAEENIEWTEEEVIDDPGSENLLPETLPETEKTVEEKTLEAGETQVKEGELPEETERANELAQPETPYPAAEPETDSDGLPAQGSIVTVEGITLPFDTWEFDPWNDFTNIDYDPARFTISYVSDDIIYDSPGVYSSIYRVTDHDTGKFWFVLRPVIVSEEETDPQTDPETEAETEPPTESETDAPEETGEEESTEDEKQEESEETEEEEPERQAELRIILQDIDGEALSGVTFQLFRTDKDEEKSLTCLTGEGGLAILKNLQAGIYEIAQADCLSGFVPDGTGKYVNVDEDGLIFECDAEGNALRADAKISDTEELIWINDYTKWEFAKVDMSGIRGISGAALQVEDSKGKVVEAWVSAENPHRINKLPTGEYALVETAAPEGYVLASAIAFTVTETGDVMTQKMIDRQVLVIKTDAFIEGLAGAKLEVRDADGTVVDAWVSDGTPHALSGLVSGQTYTLAETEAPEGYAAGSDITFTVSDDAGEERISLISKQVIVHKTDADLGMELKGAQLEVTDQSGAVADFWVSDGEPHALSNIRVGESYILKEKHAPEGYALATGIAFTVADDGTNQEVTMEDEKIELTVSKKDSTDGRELPGADLQIYDAGWNLIDEWISSEKPHKLNLAAESYTLVEKQAPEGYATAADLEFTVDESQAQQQIILYDAPIVAKFSKKDITDDRELSGAHLRLKDSDGDIVDDWISAEEPRTIANLRAGIYTLTEVTAPEGYDVAESVSFTVEDTGQLQEFSMYDSPKESTTDLTGKISTTTTADFGGNISGYTAGSARTGTGSVVASSVKTGDFFRYLGAVLLISAGGVLLLFLSLKKKRQRRR